MLITEWLMRLLILWLSTPQSCVHIALGTSKLRYWIDLSQCGEENEADCASHVKEIVTAYCDEHSDPLCSDMNLYEYHCNDGKVHCTDGTPCTNIANECECYCDSENEFESTNNEGTRPPNSQRKANPSGRQGVKSLPTESFQVMTNPPDIGQTTVSPLSDRIGINFRTIATENGRTSMTSHISAPEVTDYSSASRAGDDGTNSFTHFERHGTHNQSTTLSVSATQATNFQDPAMTVTPRSSNSNEPSTNQNYNETSSTDSPRDHTTFERPTLDSTQKDSIRIQFGNTLEAENSSEVLVSQSPSNPAPKTPLMIVMTESVADDENGVYDSTPTALLVTHNRHISTAAEQYFTPDKPVEEPETMSIQRSGLGSTKLYSESEITQTPSVQQIAITDSTVGQVHSTLEETTALESLFTTEDASIEQTTKNVLNSVQSATHSSQQNLIIAYHEITVAASDDITPKSTSPPGTIETASNSQAINAFQPISGIVSSENFGTTTFTDDLPSSSFGQSINTEHATSILTTATPAIEHTTHSYTSSSALSNPLHTMSPAAKTGDIRTYHDVTTDTFETSIASTVEPIIPNPVTHTPQTDLSSPSPSFSAEIAGINTKAMNPVPTDTIHDRPTTLPLELNSNVDFHQETSTAALYSSVDSSITSVENTARSSTEWWLTPALSTATPVIVTSHEPVMKSTITKSTKETAYESQTFRDSTFTSTQLNDERSMESSASTLSQSRDASVTSRKPTSPRFQDPTSNSVNPTNDDAIDPHVSTESAVTNAKTVSSNENAIDSAIISVRMKTANPILQETRESHRLNLISLPIADPAHTHFGSSPTQNIIDFTNVTSHVDSSSATSTKIMEPYTDKMQDENSVATYSINSPNYDNADPHQVESTHATIMSSENTIHSTDVTIQINSSLSTSTRVMHSLTPTADTPKNRDGDDHTDFGTAGAATNVVTSDSTEIPINSANVRNYIDLSLSTSNQIRDPHTEAMQGDSFDYSIIPTNYDDADPHAGTANATPISSEDIIHSSDGIPEMMTTTSFSTYAQIRELTTPTTTVTSTANDDTVHVPAGTSTGARLVQSTDVTADVTDGIDSTVSTSNQMIEGDTVSLMSSTDRHDVEARGGTAGGAFRATSVMTVESSENVVHSTNVPVAVISPVSMPNLIIETRTQTEATQAVHNNELLINRNTTEANQAQADANRPISTSAVRSVSFHELSSSANILESGIESNDSSTFTPPQAPLMLTAHTVKRADETEMSQREVTEESSVFNPTNIFTESYTTSNTPSEFLPKNEGVTTRLSKRSIFTLLSTVRGSNMDTSATFQGSSPPPDASNAATTMHDQTTSYAVKSSSDQPIDGSVTPAYQHSSSASLDASRSYKGRPEMTRADDSYSMGETTDKISNEGHEGRHDQTTTWSKAISYSQPNSVTEISTVIPTSSIEDSDEQFSIHISIQETDLKEHISIPRTVRPTNNYEIWESLLQQFHEASASNELRYQNDINQ